MRTENRKESGGELSGKSDPCAQGARYDAGGAGGKAEHLAAGGEQVGKRAFLPGYSDAAGDRGVFRRERGRALRPRERERRSERRARPGGTFAREYKEKARTITHNPFPVTRLTAYAAAKTGNRELAAEAWDELWHVWHNDKPFTVRRVEVPEVPAPVDENPVVCTNDAATWSLAAIYMQEVIPE